VGMGSALGLCSALPSGWGPVVAPLSTCRSHGRLPGDGCWAGGSKASPPAPFWEHRNHAPA
jgi:hypothetical protein